MNACTIIARNYLAHARVLARSFSEHHPNGRFTVLVIDADEEFLRQADEQFELVGPYDIGIPVRELHRMATLYDVMELATAVKPWLLMTLLDRDGEPVTYLDPDIEVFEPLDDIAELADQHSIVLTPHTLDPLPHDHLEPGEVTLLLAGMFNLGFVAVSSRAMPFLKWWSERLSRDGHVDPAQGQFVDQRWVDYVPSLFEHTVLRDPACNVAHWNLESRRLTCTDGKYFVNGRPLRFFHFSGFDPRKPHLLSKFLGPQPRILMSSHSALAQICHEYGEKLDVAGFRETSKKPYGFGRLASGTKISREIRRVYALELRWAEEGDEPEPPNPFTDGDDAFIEWLNAPHHTDASRLTRFLAALYAHRSDLQALFPDPRWVDADRFVEWAWTTGWAEEGIPRELLPAAREPQQRAALSTGGVNVAGYFRAEAGVGQAARHLLVGLERARIPFSTISYDKTLSRQAHAFDDRAGETYDVNVICVNADQLLSFGHDVGPEFFRDRHSIGMWWWEVARFPARFHGSFDLLSEVWVGSDFVRRAIAAETEKPVFKVPIGIELPDVEPTISRQELGLPDGFLFLFSFDFDSRFARKNPLGVVKAFTQAFEPGEGPTLILKTINGVRNLADLERLRFAISERDDIVLIDRYLSAEETAALTANCDSYVSLHRSEGFGLTMAEAMAYAKPVVATGYSGNLEFMTDETSCLVPYRLVPIPKGVDPYPAQSEWADPDLETAIQYMRDLYENSDRAIELGRAARQHVAEVLSPDRTAEFLAARLSHIFERRAGGPAVAPGAEPEPAPDGLERADRYLREGPTVPIRGPSRLGFVGRFFRRAVYRVLRPYTARHAEFEQAVVDGLRQLRDQISTSEQTLREQEQHERARLSSRLDLASTLQTDQLRRQAERVNAQLLQASRRDAELSAAVEDNVGIASELYAKPFLSEPDVFTVRDSAGNEVMGYEGDGDGGSASYRAFEDIFRGSEEFIRDRQSFYIDMLRSHEPVLDAGCGRGELLDLLEEAGIEATGVDLDADMVAHCRAKGHDVELADANSHLMSVQDDSLGAIVALQVVEHMPYESLLSFIDLAGSKLAPGGLLVLETVNPHSISALKAFWVDLTHEHPIFPEVLLALCRMHGFGSARVAFPNGSGDLEEDRREQGEYAVVATAGPLSTAASASAASRHSTGQ